MRGRGDVETCIDYAWARRLMDDTVRVRDPVTLTIIENAFGTAVVRIDSSS
jgi:hypothetical protein